MPSTTALSIGPYSLTSIETGTFALDGGAMFGVVPKTLWNKLQPADEENRILLHARALLIQKKADDKTPAQTILVDVGMGEKWEPRFRDMYKVSNDRWTLEKSLLVRSLRPEDITDVILTHLHFDHAGGMTKKEGAEIAPTFPNARVYLQKRNWQLAWKPNEKDRASYLQENFLPYEKDSFFKNRLELLETKAVDPTGKDSYTEPEFTEEEILPGISVIVSHGHTLGMQLVRVADGKKSITYCADLIPTSSHVRVPYIMSYDCYPIFLLAEKKKLLARVQAEGGFLFYEHCPLMPASKVALDAKGNFIDGEPVQL